MSKKINHKLFILLTDVCTLGCEFCNFSDRREKSCDNDSDFNLNYIDLNKWYAKESLDELIDWSFVVWFSWWWEPLSNSSTLTNIILRSKFKRFVLTTNWSFPKEKLENMLERINLACAVWKNKCIVRLSVDRYHENWKNYFDNLDTLLKWHFEKKWQFCNWLFFRTNILDEDFVKEKFTKICDENWWELVWDNSDNPFARVIKVNWEEFRLLLRPIVNAWEIWIYDKYNIEEYTELLSEADGHDIKVWVPKWCHWCQWCKSWWEAACLIINWLDITVDTDWEVYLYGWELSSLWSIYNEKLNFDVINDRLNNDKYYKKLLHIPLKNIIKELSKDVEFKKIIKDTNYPYAIIRNLKEANFEKLKKMLLELK